MCIKLNENAVLLQGLILVTTARVRGFESARDLRKWSASRQEQASVVNQSRFRKSSSNVTPIYFKFINGGSSKPYVLVVFLLCCLSSVYKMFSLHALFKHSSNRLIFVLSLFHIFFKCSLFIFKIGKCGHL